MPSYAELSAAVQSAKAALQAAKFSAEKDILRARELADRKVAAAREAVSRARIALADYRKDDDPAVAQRKQQLAEWHASNAQEREERMRKRAGKAFDEKFCRGRFYREERMGRRTYKTALVPWEQALAILRSEGNPHPEDPTPLLPPSPTP